MSYPNWHIRFTNARNKASEACSELEQAAYDEPAFKPLLEKARKLREKLDVQLNRNFKRGRKEGWL